MSGCPHPGVTVHAGDSLAVMGGMAAGSVDCVVTDPPYGIGYRHARGASVSEKRRSVRVVEWAPIAGDEAVDPRWLAEAFRVLRDGAALYLCCRWDVEPEWREHLRAAGFLVKQRLTWHKRTHGKGDVTGTYAQSTEDVLFATKGRHRLSGRSSALLDVGCVPTWERRFHPHQKPVDLPRVLIRTSCPSGGTVLDPFAGSGTTALAALAEGRKAVLIEKEPAYVEIIRRRVADATQPAGLFAGVQGDD